MLGQSIQGRVSEKSVLQQGQAMNYLLPEHLHPRASFISGYLKRDNQVEGLDRSFAGAIIMGHARAGTAAGILNHTYVMRDVLEARLNGRSIGEFGLNTL